MTKLKSLPLPGPLSDKRAVRTQLGALCYRIRGTKPEVLLVTTRGRGRWVIPKGWPIGGRTPGHAAVQEAWEEAGVIGTLSGNAIGIYSYIKKHDPRRLPCIVAVFPVEVAKLANDFPERRQRRRKWFSPRKAAAKVDAPDLRQILLTFDPRRL